MSGLTDRIDEAHAHLTAAEDEERPIVAYARRCEALRLLGAVQRDLDGLVRGASEAVENLLLEQGVTKLRLADPAVTLYTERRPFIGIVYAEGESEDTDAGHARAARALEAAGLSEFASVRVKLQSLTAHYREILKDEGEEAAAQRITEELGGTLALTVTSKVKTRKSD